MVEENIVSIHQYLGHCHKYDTVVTDIQIPVSAKLTNVGMLNILELAYLNALQSSSRIDTNLDL